MEQVYICELCLKPTEPDQVVSHPLTRNDDLADELHPECLAIINKGTAWLLREGADTSTAADTIDSAMKTWRAVPPKIGEWRAANGITFVVAVVLPGEKYGRNFACTNGTDMAMVEFYDARYRHTQNGQFVSRYTLDCFMGCSTVSFGSGDLYSHGINLDGGIEDWSIDGATRKEIARELMAWLSGQAQAEVKQ